MEGRAPYLAPKIWALFPAHLDGEGSQRAGALGTLGGWRGISLTIGGKGSNSHSANVVLASDITCEGLPLNLNGDRGVGRHRNDGASFRQ